MESLHVADRSFQTTAARLYRTQVLRDILRYAKAVQVVYHATSRATPRVVKAWLSGILLCLCNYTHIRATNRATCESFSSEALPSTNANTSKLTSPTSDQHGTGLRAFHTSSKLEHDSSTRPEVTGDACIRFMDLRYLDLLHNIRDNITDQCRSIPYRTSSSGHKFSG